MRLAPPWRAASWLLVACGAICGHVFSFWLKFRGGKGVATGLGVVLGVWPYFTVPGLAALALWVAVTLATRYVSAGSIAAAAAFVPMVAVWCILRGWSAKELWPLLAFAAAMVLLIIVRHRDEHLAADSGDREQDRQRRQNLNV